MSRLAEDRVFLRVGHFEAFVRLRDAASGCLGYDSVFKKTVKNHKSAILLSELDEQRR